MLLDAQALKKPRSEPKADNLGGPVTWFWVGVAILLGSSVFIVRVDSPKTISGAFLIAFAALLPLYLWISERAKGLPIFPLFALTFLWTYAIPLVIDHPEVIQYPPEMHLRASLVTSGFLFLGTLVWYYFVKTAPEAPSVLRVFEGKQGEPFLLVGLTVSVLFSIAFAAGWTNLDAGFFAVLRATVISVNNLSMFALAFRWGTLEMRRKRRRLFLFLVAIYILANSATLLLINALSALLLIGVAFSLGRRTIPFMSILILVAFVIPLHYGKAQMREKYWMEPGAVSFKPWEYPALFAEWAGYSYVQLFDTSEQSSDDSPQSFAERAGLINLMLMAQDQTSNDRPFLNGASYLVIPRLLIPRFLDPGKPASHEGTYLLNIHFGRQTREDTYRTTIGWGLLNEAYANFGVWGVGALAIMLGSLYGVVARWSWGCPVLSARYLFAILLISVACRTEFAASVFVTMLFQSAIPLLALTFLLMKTSEGNNPKTREAIRLSQ